MGIFFDGQGAYRWSEDGVAKSWIGEDAAWESPGSVVSPGGLTMSARVGLSKNLTPEECFALSVSFQAGVAAYDRNLSRCQLRIFTRSGEEVESGKPVQFFKRPAPGLSYRQWASCFIHWWLIRGEVVAKLQTDGDGRLYAVLPLEPGRLQPDGNGRYKDALDVPRWRYLWRDGEQEKIPSGRLLYDAAFNPLPNDIRGLSPALTGGVEMTAQRNALLWAKRYFDNSTQPGGMLILPEGVPRQQREDVERKFTQDFGATYGNAHRTFVISGSKDVKWEPIEQGFSDKDAFHDLQKSMNRKVGQLLGVPDIEMGGVDDDTRFKSAPEARKVFFEQRLAPLAERFSDLFQHQLVDPFMRGMSRSDYAVARPRNNRQPDKKGFSRGMGECYEKALADRPDASFVVLIDTDTSPISDDVQLARSINMIAFRDATMCSPKDACENFKVDIQNDDPVRSIIWTDQKYLPASDPELAKKLIPGLVPKPAGESGSGGGGSKPAKAFADTAEVGASATDVPDSRPTPLSPDQKDTLAKAVRLVRSLRRLTMETLAKGELWSLSDADAINELGAPLHTEIRQVRFALRQLQKQHGDDRDALLAAARKLFNELQKDSHLKSALGL
jgi:phage portal protein BeeE